MLTRRNNIPLDYSLCVMTVTVYHREGLTRHVIPNAHYEFTSSRAIESGMETLDRGFLLVIPGTADIRCGDKVVLGIGPEIQGWAQLNVPGVDTLGVVATVKPRYFRGKLCHTEARG